MTTEDAEEAHRLLLDLTSLIYYLSIFGGYTKTD